MNERSIHPKFTYYHDGSIETEEWLINGKFHRADGPAYSSYYISGHPITMSWYIDGKYHRLDGPAVISYFANNQLMMSEKWFVNGVLHRLDGPAAKHYLPSGQHWYINGQRVQPFDNDIFLVRSCVHAFNAVPRSVRKFLKEKGYSSKEIAMMRVNATALLRLL